MNRYLWIGAILLGTLLVAVILRSTEPLPPRRVVMATGAPGGVYSATGERYREYFARSGVQLELRPTDGAVENVALLNDPASGVSIALVQSGTTTTEQSPHLESLGTLFYEPFWLFQRANADRLRSNARKRISLGTPGSGTYRAALEIARDLRIDLSNTELVNLSASEAGEAMLRGELDYAAMALSAEAPIVLKLLRDPAIEALSWPLADAFVALRPSLSKVTVPRGVADLGAIRPPQDLTLLAAKASLVVREDLHPALQYLLLEAAGEIQAQPALFHHSGQFPAAEPIDLPLSEPAREYYAGGRPLLQRYLPFWMAALTGRLLLLLIPLIGLAYPIFRIVPAVYDWVMRRRIFVLYGELKFVEAELDAKGPGALHSQLALRLDQLEERANTLRVPVSFAQMLYTLKVHIELVRQRMREMAEALPKH